MSAAVPRETGPVLSEVEADLLATLVATLMPALIMSGLFAGVGAVILTQVGGIFLPAAYALGLACSVARIGVMLRFRRAWKGGRPDAVAARRIVRGFAATYLAFAGLLGMFAAGAAFLGPREVGTLAAVLVTGYAAGVSTGVAARARLALAAMALGVVPLIVAQAAAGSLFGLTLAVMLLAFLVGGMRSTVVRGRGLAGEIAMRHSYAALARRDHLTGLPNRLALDERLADLARSGEDATIFCVDLDGFKPVNDLHGHVAGDAVLREMGRRFSALLRPSDFVARMGGDEFVLICRGLRDDHARDALAARVGAAAGEAIILAGQPLVIGATVGAAGTVSGEDPRQTLALADERLCRAKGARRDRKIAAEQPGNVVRLPVTRRTA